jgi:hypothetical protein
MPRKALLFISLYLLLVLVDAGLAATANRFGEVYDLEGTVKIFSTDGRVTNLKPGRDLFYPIKEGDRIEVQQGKAIIVSAAQKGYEITANSVGTVRDGKLVTIKGTVAAKEGLPAPSGETAGAIGGMVIRSLNKNVPPVGGYDTDVSETAHQGQSTITDIEGQACMGDDKSRKQTEQAAMSDARRRAAEFALTYLKSETQVKDFTLEKDLLSAYSNAQVKIIQQLESFWYKDPVAGDCYMTKLKAEVIPNEKVMTAASRESAMGEPNAPLRVTVWTDKKEYKKGDKIRVYVKGNKPFYARVLYRDAVGAILQLLPNPYRLDAYFNGGTVYEIPSGSDRFDLEVSPPFGEENIVVYGSTAELGSIETRAEGNVYRVMTRTQDMGVKVRGIKITGKQGKVSTAEFYEETQSVKTRR